MRENLKIKSFHELNEKFFAWQIKFNQEFKSEGLGMNKRTPAEVYQPSERRKPLQELTQLFFESFNSLRKECLGWTKYKQKQLSKLTKEVESYLKWYHYHRPHLE